MNKPTVQTKTYGKPKTSDSGGGKTIINYNVDSNVNTSGNINARSATINNVLADYIKTNKIDATYGNITYLVSSDGTISNLRGDTLEYSNGNISNINADSITTNELTANNANLTNIFNEYLQSREITTDYLTVNKAFHAFEMIIDKIKSVGGTIINTATSCILDFVQPLDSNDKLTDEPIKYRCYWKATDDSGNKTSNDWWVNDQAISQNVNLVSGTNHDAGNHYYWRLVEAVSQNPVWVNFHTGEVDNQSTDRPDYTIQFENMGDDGLFLYDNGLSGNNHYTLTDWLPSSEELNKWDDQNNILTVDDTTHGLQFIPPVISDSSATDFEVPYSIKNGFFEFATAKICSPNFAIYYDDDSVEIHTVPEIVDTIPENGGDYIIYDTDKYIYHFEMVNPNDTITTKTVITMDNVDIWHSCHWIDLSNDNSNGHNGYNVPTHIDPTKYDMAPQPNDNLVQLGYRYTNLQNPTQEDKSRASAIIIAAFKTPDQGDPNNQEEHPAVVPPSYAQYQLIRDFNLWQYRGTYFDATGAYINGALIVGSTIDTSSLDIDVKTYKIVSEVNPITRDANGNLNLGANSKLDISFIVMENGNGTTYSNVPASMTLYWTTTTSSGTVSAGNHPAISIAAGDTEVTLELRTSNSNVADKTVISIIDLGSVTDGKDGAYNQWAYKNNPITPSKPSSTSTYPPSGWTAQPSQPSDGEFTYMITRTVTPSNANPYGAWSTPLRITGEDGQPGTDGTDFEFVYTLSQISSTEVGNPVWVPNITEPTDHTADSYIPPVWSYTLNGVEYTGDWTNHPQGISSTYMYEYMSQRYSYIDNGIKYWSNFTTPALWSKWGENGMDGDGVKYVFRKFKPASTADIYAPTFVGNGYPNNQDYYADTNRNIWYDNSMEPDATGDVYCSQSTNYQVLEVNNAKQIFWTNFQEPKKWLTYVKNGENGQTGPQGPQGPGTDSYQLVPLNEVFEVRLSSSTEKYENLVGHLYTNLKYVIKIDNTDTPSFETNLSGYTMTVTTDAKTSSSGTYRTVSPTIGTVTIDNKSVACFNVSYANLLSLFYSGSKLNYYYLHQSGESWEMITRLDIVVKKGANTIDSRTVELIFKPDHLFYANEYSLQSVYQGLSGETGTTNWSTGFSQIKQTWDNINTTVNNLTTIGTFPQSDNLKQYGWYIKQTVSAPSAPTGDLPNSNSVEGQWTSYNHPLATSDYAYGFVTYRTRTSYMSGSYMQYSNWSSWTAPQLYYTYAIPNPKLINSAGLDIKANEINLGINTKTKDITDKLYYTGINIRAATPTNPGTITLRADKVTFTNSAGTVTDKISIDPTTGTLNATNANLTGKFIANNSTYATNVTIDNSSRPHLVVNAPQLITDEQTPGAATTTMVDITTDYAVNRDIQGKIALYWPANNQTIEIDAADGITKYTSGNSEYTSWDDIISGVRNSKNYMMDVHNTDKWNSGISGLSGSYTIDYLHAEDDIYLFTVATENAVFDIRSTIRDNQGNYYSTGKYNGRIIRIHGYPGLCICSGDANTGTGIIITKDTYYGGQNSSIEMLKLGSTSNSAYTAFSHSTRKKTVDYWTITLVQYNGNWWEI